MNATELDKFYSLGNVEGLAFIDANQVLVENQMLVSEEVASALAYSFSGIFGGLAAARRPCKGFLVRTSKNQFLGLPVLTGIVILQLNPADEVDKYFREAVSIIGTQTGSEIAEISTSTTVVQPALPGQQVVAQAQAQPEAGGDLAGIYNDFISSLSKALIKVAPQNVTKKILAQAHEQVLEGASAPASKEQIYAIGQHAVSAVPNAGRRKLVEKELELITQRCLNAET